ncbi:transmembrane protein 11, mitochondrial-like isoform X2 [Artemia franciscana]|uniref:Transmembrane protein 11 n=1 Tax=Artemia franciscana TaxID=6661 RepID=A0AA88HHF3_ARTSF|nr:hypothetical protein QYM36_012523 [Artemia franciscana]
MEDDFDVNRQEIGFVREVYGDSNTGEQFEIELENALEAGYEVIVIEPHRLGDETARWIQVGNCLHKTAVLAGFGTILIGSAFKNRTFVYLPLGALSFLCTAIYTLSWQSDPCCKYQIESDTNRLARIPLRSLTSSTPVVLVRRDDSRRRTLHCVMTFCAIGLCVYRLVRR